MASLCFYKYLSLFMVQLLYKLAPLIIMQAFSPQEFIQQLSLMFQGDYKLSEKSNSYINLHLEKPELLPLAEHLIMQAQSIQHQTIGAKLMHLKLQQNYENLPLDELLRLKQLFWRRLQDTQFHKTSNSLLCGAMGFLVVVLYPENWVDFIAELTQFMQQDKKHFLIGLNILERVAEQIRCSKIQRSIRMKAMKSFCKDNSTELATFFNFIVEINLQDINTFFIETLEFWSKVNFPFLTYPTIIDFVLKHVIEEGKIIRLGTLPILISALKCASITKTKDIDITLNFDQSIYSESQLQSLNLITNFLTKQQFWLQQSLEINLLGEDITYFVELIKQVLFKCAFLLFTEKGEEILWFIIRLLDNRSRKISCQTFSFFSSFFDNIQKQIQQHTQIHLQQIAINILKTLLEKITLSIQQIKQEANELDQTRQDEQIGFQEYRELSTPILRSIHDFLIKTNSDQAIGAQKFFTYVQSIWKNFVNHQKSIGIQLVVLIIQSCFGRGLSNIPYQTNKALHFLHQTLNFCENYQAFVYNLASQKILILIQLYRFQISHYGALYDSALKFATKHLSNENISLLAAKAFESLLQKVSEHMTTEVTEQIKLFYLKHNFQNSQVQNKMLQSLIKVNSKLLSSQNQINNLAQVLECIDAKADIMLKTTRGQFIDSTLPYTNAINEIKLFLTLEQAISQNQVTEEFFLFARRRLGKSAIKVIESALFFIINCAKSYDDYKKIVKCAQTFKNIVDSIPMQELIWQSHQTLINLLQTVFSLFQISNLKELLQKGELVNLASFLLKTLARRVSTAVDQWLKQHLKHIIGFFEEYYNIYCMPDFKEADPDVMRAYFTLQQALCMYDFQLFLEYLPATILEFSMICLEKIVEKKLQKQILSFMLRYLERKGQLENGNEVGGWLISQLMSYVPAFKPASLNLTAKIIMVVFNNIIHQGHDFIVANALNNEKLSYVDDKIKQLTVRFLPVFALKQNKRYTKGVLKKLAELKHKQDEEAQFQDLQQLYGIWVQKLQNKQESEEDESSQAQESQTE